MMADEKEMCDWARILRALGLTEAAEEFSRLQAEAERLRETLRQYADNPEKVISEQRGEPWVLIHGQLLQELSSHSLAKEVASLKKQLGERDAEIESLESDNEKLADDLNSATWQKLQDLGQRILDRWFPEEIFTGASGDAGPQYIVALRESLRRVSELAPNIKAVTADQRISSLEKQLEQAREWARLSKLMSCPCSNPDGKECSCATFSEPNGYPCRCVCHEKAQASLKSELREEQP